MHVEIGNKDQEETKVREQRIKKGECQIAGMVNLQAQSLWTVLEQIKQTGTMCEKEVLDIQIIVISPPSSSCS